jgi:hypothetical protein
MGKLYVLQFGRKPLAIWTAVQSPISPAVPEHGA